MNGSSFSVLQGSTTCCQSRSEDKLWLIAGEFTLPGGHSVCWSQWSYAAALERDLGDKDCNTDRNVGEADHKKSWLILHFYLPSKTFTMMQAPSLRWRKWPCYFRTGYTSLSSICLLQAELVLTFVLHRSQLTPSFLQTAHGQHDCKYFDKGFFDNMQKYLLHAKIKWLKIGKKIISLNLTE